MHFASWPSNDYSIVINCDNLQLQPTISTPTTHLPRSSFTTQDRGHWIKNLKGATALLTRSISVSAAAQECCGGEMEN